MRDPLLQSLRNFLSKQVVEGPLLLGYSGGPDSKALLYLLLAVRQFVPIDLQVVHINHNWREESGAQAAQLEQELHALGIPFHLYQLASPPSKNLESQARQARWNCYKKTYCEIGAQALLLAHQADDQAETVLKRIFEGAHFRQTTGMQEISVWEGIPVWRPLLPHPKKAIFDWLEAHGLTGIDDPTNRDPRFLRGKMRTALLPQLSELFGKEVQGNLCRLGAVARELSGYFSRKLAHCFDKLEVSPEGVLWDLSGIDLEKIEWEYLLKEWLTRQKVVLSAQIFEQCVSHLREKRSAKTFSMGGVHLLIDRGKLHYKFK